MKQIIGIRLTQLASQYTNFYLAEAEEETYPYAVYTIDATPVYTKDGIHHYEANVFVTVYAKELEKCDLIADSISTAVTEDMNGGQFYARLLSDKDDCSDGVWSRELNFTIKQYQ